MKKEVLINITGEQGLGEAPDKIEFSTVGFMEEKNGETAFYYDESGMIEGAKIDTALKISANNSVILERTGDINSRLVLEKGKRNSCLYSTAFGDMMIGIYCDNLLVDLKPEGGKIFMDYSIDSNLNEISKNKVTVNIRKV